MKWPTCVECRRRLKPWELTTCGRCLRATMRIVKAEKRLDKAAKKKGK